MNRFSIVPRTLQKGINRINLASGVLCGTRGIHALAPVPYVTDNGLEPLYSKETLNRLYNQRQKMLLEKVDELAKGTEFQSRTLKEIVTLTSTFPEHAALYNYASQAWNFDFFLQSLTDRPHEPNMIVKGILASYFGSFEGFKTTFTMYAQGIFGNGWTWLAIDREGTLFIKNTYNGGSLFSMVPANRKGYLSAGTKEIIKLTNKYEEGMSRVPINQMTTLSPILCLNMWTDSYLADFGYDREKYIEAFWKVVNWDSVSQKLYKKEI
ncbi:Superoxide dismutase [Fe] [Smittium mucronatum]|uniref:Superoxide dismutase [Fe] n=1 Tax=Smittium mucronatum TaxID=133383 RepID=A0A1R0GQB7_9FUNG|nr:Superoxide dismutase [Fe] [Smittium mucronatum]